ncbi:hypothetical protein [Stenotrophomonas sp. YIM B06876]|uniref:hypothetical protein n=1 Tax=Stenotrophomonas sp. YIM B06876 TaxID=3060211 RepID=UPI00273A4261|nr:hypothetical protein [Stenotrophomonas sp. YIM B06876]
MRTLFFALVLGVPALAAAQRETGPSYLSSTPLVSAAAEPGLGIALRAPVQNAVAASMAGRHEEALPALRQAARSCDAYRAVTGRRTFSFRSQRQYLLYMEEAGGGHPTEWLDHACSSAYTRLGYIDIERNRIDSALAWLDQAIAVAPYEAEPLCERGAALTRRKDWKGSLQAYQQALALARRHPEAAHMEAMALRGTGFALIELGDLAAARAAYEASQVLDPESATARNELRYIVQLQQRAEAAD